MFFGTKTWFKILYFITSMSPAYVLYCLHLYASNQIALFGYKEYTVLIISLFLFVIFISLAYILKRILIRTTMKNENPYKLKINVLNQNGNSLVFLLSVIIPSVIYIETSLTTNILVFLFVQYLLFTLMSNSTTLFPNVLLIIIGIHTFKLNNGKYLISNQFNHKSDEIINATSIGDNSNTLCYVKGR